MSSKRYDVVLIGALAQMDLILADALSQEGLRCAIVRLPGTAKPDPSTWPSPLRAFRLEDLYPYRNANWFWTFSRAATCVVSITSVLPFALQGWWAALPWLGYPPIVNVSTGSDVAELARERSRSGWVCRSLLRRAAVNYVPAYPEVVRSITALRLANFEFFRYAYWLAPCTTTRRPDGPILFFHPSHLDWGFTDVKPSRNSTKGNDRFFRAFFRAAANGANIRCVLLDRGPDRGVARELIAKCGYADRFEWLPPLGQAALCERMRDCDVVVDQFDVGGFGGIAIEAMALGKPVLIHIDPDTWPLVYDTPPPILACRTEDEIHQAILRSQDRTAMAALGRQAAGWVDDNYRSGAVAKRMACKIAVITGKGWPLPARSAANLVEPDRSADCL